jgi:acetyltransferase-like isoleucine patch superfamily enzyme
MMSSEPQISLRMIIRRMYFLTMNLLRHPLYLFRNSEVALNSWVERGVVLVDSTVGSYSYLGGGVYLITTRIGSYCSIATGAKIGGMEHSWWWGSTSPRIRDQNSPARETLIEDDVWIGSNAVVRQGLRIGRGAVIGAGSVVLKDVSPYAIVAGVPAREIRKRFPEDVVQKVVKTKFWEHPPDRARELLDAIDFPDASCRSVDSSRQA